MAAQVALRRQMDDRSLIEDNEDDNRKMGIRAIAEKAKDDISFASTGKLYALCSHIENFFSSRRFYLFSY